MANENGVKDPGSKAPPRDCTTSGGSPRVTRRNVLRRAGAVTMAAVGSSFWTGKGIGQPRSRLSSGNSSFYSSGLSLRLRFSDGSPTLSFKQSAASRIGTYVGAFVRQKCLRQRVGPWTVFFRPDANGLRQEVVVEYGTEYIFASGAAPVTLSGAAPAHITAPYTATISGGGLAAPVAIAVPNHWWGARWRWQSAPRPCVRAYTDLLAMKAVLPLSTTPLWNTSPPAATAWAGPMATGDLNTYLATTGDRDELGFVTEQQACYLLTGNAAALEFDADRRGSLGNDDLPHPRCRHRRAVQRRIAPQHGSGQQRRPPRVCDSHCANVNGQQLFQHGRGRGTHAGAGLRAVAPDRRPVLSRRGAGRGQL